MSEHDQTLSRKKTLSSSLNNDELLLCLQAVARIHQHEASSESLTAGLPLEDGKLTPSVFARAAARAGMTARIVKSGLVNLNPELFPVVVLLEPGRACIVTSLSLIHI